jgi:hypothetical protein
MTVSAATLLAVALEKLWAPRRVSTYVHRLVPVVAVARKNKSFLVDLGLDPSKANRALQFRQVHIAVSGAVFDLSPIVQVRMVDATIQSSRCLSNLLARARAASRA